MLVSDPRYAKIVRADKIKRAIEFACDFYNTDRNTFVCMAATRYPLVEEAYLFNTAVREYDTINRELNEYFENVA